MSKILSDSFREQKRASCQRELSRIRGLSASIEQAQALHAQLYDVLTWQGILPEIHDNVFDINWDKDRFSLVFWPLLAEALEQKQRLNLRIVDQCVSKDSTRIVLATSLVGFDDDLLVSARAQNGRILLLDGTDVDVLCSLDWMFSQMVRFKQREMRLYGQPNVNYLAYLGKVRIEDNTPVMISLEELLSKGTSTEAKLFREDAQARWVDFEENLIVQWPQLAMSLDFVTQSSNARHALIVSGRAGSGKSTFLYELGYRYSIAHHLPVRYFNTANMQLENIEQIIDEAIALPEGSVVLLDDLHQRAVHANKVIGAILAEGKGIRIVAATRPPYFNQLKDPLTGTFGWRQFETEKIDLEPKIIVDAIIEQFIKKAGIQIPAGTLQKLKREVGQDITVLGWVLRHLEPDETRTQITYEEAVSKYRIKPLLADPELGVEALALLYIVTFFEQFDVRIRDDFLLSLGFSDDLIWKLVSLGYLVNQRGVLGVGHANLARLYVGTLDNQPHTGWLALLASRLKALTGEQSVGFDNVKLSLLDAYFNHREVEARSRAMLNVFEYFAPEIHMTQLHRDMIRTVNAVERAMAMLILYFQRDPTAESSVSNSAFICQAFVKFGRMDLAKQSLDFMLSRQASYQDGSARFVLDPIHVTTVRDFEEIKKRTAMEDNAPDERTVELLTKIHRSGTPKVSIADQTDFDRFHQTWLSAMVLPSITAVYGKEHPRYEQTLKTVLINQDQQEGWFYPPEFCWSTARCVSNLIQIGLPLDSTGIVGGRNWLLRLQLKDGRWHSPDWLWNPDEEMTAMCLYALLRAGLSKDHPSVQLAQEWLASRQENGCWNENAHDTGHVVEALNALNVPLDDLRAPLRFLERRVSRDDWYQTTIGKERRQSLEIGELANVLLEVETKYLFSYVRSVISAE